MLRELILIIAFPFIAFGQMNDLDSLNELKENFSPYKDFESIIRVCLLMKDLDPKANKQYDIDNSLIWAYMDKGDTLTAIALAKKYIPFVYIPKLSRGEIWKNMKYRTISNQLYEYYFGIGKYKKAYKYASKIRRRFNRDMCGMGRGSIIARSFEKMIDCAEKSGKCFKAKRLTRKLERFFKQN